MVKFHACLVWDSLLEELESEAVCSVCSFTVPASLSSSQLQEPWAKSFESGVLKGWTTSAPGVWRNLTLECTTCEPQTIAL